LNEFDKNEEIREIRDILENGSGNQNRQKSIMNFLNFLQNMLVKSYENLCIYKPVFKYIEVFSMCRKLRFNEEVNGFNNWKRNNCNSEKKKMALLENIFNTKN